MVFYSLRVARPRRGLRCGESAMAVASAVPRTLQRASVGLVLAHLSGRMGTEPQSEAVTRAPAADGDTETGNRELEQDGDCGDGLMANVTTERNCMTHGRALLMPEGHAVKAAQHRVSGRSEAQRLYSVAHNANTVGAPSTEAKEGARRAPKAGQLCRGRALDRAARRAVCN